MLHDYPEWMYQGWLTHSLLSGDPAVAARYELVTYPVPNALTQVSIGMLGMVLPPVLAGQVWLAVYFAAAAAIAGMLWFRYRDPAQVLLLTVVIVFGPGFWNGYMNFQFGLLIFAAYLLSTSVTRQPGVFRTLLFSLLILFSHAAVYAVFVVYCVVTRLTAVRVSMRVRVIPLLALLPSLALLSWYTVVLLSKYESAGGASMGWLKWAQYKAYTLAKQGPFHNFIDHTGESLLQRADWFYLIGFAANFLFAGLLLCWCLWLLWCGMKRGGHVLRSEAASPVVLLISIAVCVLVFLAAGANTFGVVNLGERFLIVALLLALLHFRSPAVLSNLMVSVAAVFALYLVAASVILSSQTLQAYTVARSSATSDLSAYVDDIYANSRHQYFNHRLFIYADRGLELQKDAPRLLDIDLQTSIVRRIQ